MNCTLNSFVHCRRKIGKIKGKKKIIAFQDDKGDLAVSQQENYTGLTVKDSSKVTKTPVCTEPPVTLVENIFNIGSLHHIIATEATVLQ